MSASARARGCRSERKSVFPQDAYGELIRRGRGGGCISAGTAQGKTSVCVRASARVRARACVRTLFAPIARSWISALIWPLIASEQEKDLGFQSRKKKHVCFMSLLNPLRQQKNLFDHTVCISN